MSDKEVLDSIGRRLKEARLRKNFSQAKVASDAGISVKAVQNAEKGDSKLSTYIKIMRVLRLLEELDNFLPEKRLTPKQLIAMEGKKRQRASTKWGQSKSSTSTQKVAENFSNSLLPGTDYKKYLKTLKEEQGVVKKTSDGDK